MSTPPCNATCGHASHAATTTSVTTYRCMLMRCQSLSTQSRTVSTLRCCHPESTALQGTARMHRSACHSQRSILQGTAQKTTMTVHAVSTSHRHTTTAQCTLGTCTHLCKWSWPRTCCWNQMGTRHMPHHGHLLSSCPGCTAGSWCHTPRTQGHKLPQHNTDDAKVAQRSVQVSAGAGRSRHLQSTAALSASLQLTGTTRVQGASVGAVSGTALAVHLVNRLCHHQLPAN